MEHGNTKSKLPLDTTITLEQLQSCVPANAWRVASKQLVATFETTFIKLSAAPWFPKELRSGQANTLLHPSQFSRGNAVAFIRAGLPHIPLGDMEYYMTLVSSAWEALPSWELQQADLISFLQVPTNTLEPQPSSSCAQGHVSVFLRVARTIATQPRYDPC